MILVTNYAVLFLLQQGGHYSWKLLEPPGIEFTPGISLLEIDILPRTPGKTLRNSYAEVCSC